MSDEQHLNHKNKTGKEECVLIANNYISFTQLWKGEQIILADLAKAVPKNGTIVEIGSAEGGTALLMSRATMGKGVKIFTIDISPSPNINKNLEGTDVISIIDSSVNCANRWSEISGNPIDLLYIDGGHTLSDIYHDFNYWAPYVKQGGKIVFHDYDPVERGGIAHLGVKICVDSILRKDFLLDNVHNYRMLYGTVRQQIELKLSPEDCFDSLSNLAKHIIHIEETDYNDSIIVADDRFGLLLQGLLKAEKEIKILNPSQVENTELKYLVSAHPNKLPLDFVRERKVPQKNITLIDSLIACYLIGDKIGEHYNFLYSHSQIKRDFIYWAEALFMFKRAFLNQRFPRGVENIFGNMEIDQISNFIAGEQVRLALLSRILRNFVEWIP